MTTELLTVGVGPRPVPPPPQLTRLIGRELELAEVRRALAANRLVTLTGIGGSGKTRLAAEVALRASRGDPSGIAWVDLVPLSDGALLARHVAAALGLLECLERSPLETVVEKLRGLTFLVVFDNCEHLVADCASLAHTLLAECPGLRILATSREALGVAGEVAWSVPPLSLPASADPPTADGTSHSEAVQLFVGRAQAAQPGFVLTDRNAPAVAHVCRQLDGLPLAIELAAARMNVLSVEQIAHRLDDVFGLLSTRSRTAPSRHRTLRDAIDWSYDLLEEREKDLFRRLAVFVGGFTLEAAEQVCQGPGISDEDVLDLVSALVDKSLVRSEARHDEARFTLLEPVRQYAAEKLAAAGEEELFRTRHAACFLELAERAEPETRGGTRGTFWMTRLERDHGNLRAAAEWCAADPSRVETLLRLEAALLWFYFAQGLFREPRHRLERALGRVGGGAVPGAGRVSVPDAVLGHAYTALGFQAIWQGDYPAVVEPLQRAAALLRDAGDPGGLAFALIGLGSVVGLAGDTTAAHALLDEAQATLGGRAGSRAGGFPALLLFAFASYWRGIVSQFHGDLARARASFETSVEIAREAGNHESIAHPLSALAGLLTTQGDFAGARACLAEALPIHTAHDDRWGLADALEGAAHLAAAEGAPERATRILGAADEIRESTGIPLPPPHRAARARLRAAIVERLGDAAFAAAHAAGRTLTLQSLMAEAIGRSERSSSERTAESTAASATGAPTPTAPATARRPPDVQEADLAVLALGPLQILRRGEPLGAGAWGSAKPRELLLYLLTEREGATREQVGLALWPDASLERVGNSFHVTLHRLRKALGEPAWVTKVGERYGVSRDIRALFDASLFEDQVGAALADARAGRAAPEKLRAALGLYRGPFLEDEVVGDWHVPVRDRLQRIHLEGGLALGAELARAGRYAEAADAYWRVIADDDLHEPAYRELMTCLARSGDRSQALRLFQRLAALLDKELGARPEPETVALYERLQEAEAL